MQEKGSELEKQDSGFQISGEITEEDFENLLIESHVPVFIFCQPYREKEYRKSEYWTSNTKPVSYTHLDVYKRQEIG